MDALELSRSPLFFFLFEAKQNNKHTSGLVHRVLFYSDSPVFLNPTLNPFFPLTNGGANVKMCDNPHLSSENGKKQLVGRFRVDRFALFLEG